MSLINATAIHNGAAFEIEQSLRFNDDDSAYLGRTPASDGNRKTMTFSFWSKRGDFAEQRIFGASSDNYIAWSASDQIELNLRNGGSSSNAFVITTAKYRDFSAWYHVVVAIDTTQSTAANRVKIYVNGEQETSLGTATYPSQNNDINNFNRNTGQFIGKFLSGSPYDGYLAEVNFIDGQGLTPNSFGETGTYGEWKPKKYRGTYGTNGFHLPFKQDYAVEGFSTVVYEGTGTSQYVGGVGFQPDFIWGKSRGEARSHYLFDASRGANNYLSSNSTGASADHTQIQTSFDNDGFTVGTSTALNRDGYDHVAWCWDMGNSYGTPVTITASGSAQHQTGTGAPVGASSIYIGVNNYLSMPDDKKYDFQGDFTVECYIKRNGTQSGSAAILSKYEVAGWILEVAASTNKVQWRDQNDGSSNMTSTTVLTTATWYHVAVTRQNDMFMMFIDGVLEDTKGTDYNYSISGMNQTLKLGRYSNANSNAFDGWVDEVRISNKARYVSNFTPSTTAFSNDGDTILLIHSNTSNGSTTFVDSSGAAVNTSGSITSSVSVNTAYGQSIVKYTGTGSAATVGHGLASAPDMIICKSDTNGYNWPVYHSGLASAAHTATLDITAVSAVETNKFNGTAPTSSVFSVGTHGTNVSSASQIAYCFHDVAGYSKFSTYEGTGGTHAITLGFAPAFVMIKNVDAVAQWTMWDNTRNPTNPVTQMLRANTDGAENTKTDREPSFTATGFTIGDADADTNASGQTYIYMAFADTREYAYWLDQSGNNNDWTSYNQTESDISVDSPSNNFATWNPLFSNGTLSEGNLQASVTDNRSVIASMGMETGKWYWEVYVKSGSGHHIGIMDMDFNHLTETYGVTKSITMYYDGRVFQDGSNISTDTSRAYAIGDIISWTYDSSNRQAKVYKNNALQYTRTLTAPTYGVYFPKLSSGGSPVSVTNFGQDSSFAGSKTAQGNQDGNDVGDFYYTPPTGFLSLCTKNLPEVDVIPSENFNTMLYTGTRQNKVITGVGFQPDFIWIKTRSTSSNHALVDSVRGGGKALQSSTTSYENQYGAQDDKVTAFSSDGFSLGVDAGGYGFNNNNSTYAAWNWKSGGATPSKTYTVTVVSDSGNKYRFDGFGTSAATLNLQEGGTYTFNYPSAHPFKFSTTSNGTHASGSEYTTGVTHNSSTQTTIVVAASAPALYYYCSLHSGMGGAVNTNATFGSSDFSGSIISTVSANVDAGFSIVSYTGTGAIASTIGHGLASAPTMIIRKDRGAAVNWAVYHASMGTGNGNLALFLNTTSAQDGGQGFMNNTTPTASVFTQGDQGFVGVSGRNYISYCFHSVDGYCKVGSYQGNGNADGTFVYTGFRPAYVMVKRTDSAGNGWGIKDAARFPSNVMNGYLFADVNNAEGTASSLDMDFTSNGFKWRGTSSDGNTSGGTYIYLAFAEQPFKHSNAR